MQCTTYRYRKGDVMRLRHSSPLAVAGDYVVRSADDIVSMSRLVRNSRGRTLSRRRVYLLVTDLGMFEETGYTVRVAEGDQRPSGAGAHEPGSPIAAAA